MVENGNDHKPYTAHHLQEGEILNVSQHMGTVSNVKKERILRDMEHPFSDINSVIKEELPVNESDLQITTTKEDSGVQTVVEEKVISKSYKEHLNHETFLWQQNASEKNECDICKKCFSNAEDLLRHKLIHSSGVGYHCTVCSKSFAKKSHLVMHVKIHNGVEAHRCDTCVVNNFQHGGLLHSIQLQQLSH